MENSGGAAGPTDGPDIMNDPVFDTNFASKGKSAEDADTCRICRGEGSKEEPLFYPCKCSGSIKFVHQNCLMEWLSHTQKKHCELCKTPFRFTKLYSPNMPNSVPPLVFIRQAIVHGYKSLLSWWRLQLVLFVWAICLPYCMRAIWRALFWFADGGWISWQLAEHRAKKYMESIAATGTTPADLHQFTSSDTAASSMMAQLSNSMHARLEPTATTSSFFRREPLLYRISKRLVRSMISRSSNETGQTIQSPTFTNTTIAPMLEAHHSSLLSNVTFLKTLTRFPNVNKMLIDMFEGQIITLAMVVAFILIFLIREWVVQQQPAVAMAANAVGADVQAENAPEAAVPADAPIADSNQDQADRNTEQELEQDVGEQQPPPRSVDMDIQSLPNIESGIVKVKPTMQERLRWLDEHNFPHDLLDLPDPADESYEDSRDSEVGASRTDSDDDTELQDTSRPEFSRNGSRPGMPTREALGRAAEIRRTLEENSAGQSDRPSSMNIFTDIWVRAGNRPSEVLRIIDREGRNEELNWIVLAMRRLENNSSTDDRQEAPSSSNNQPTTNENRSLSDPRAQNGSAIPKSSSPKLATHWLDDDIPSSPHADNGNAIIEPDSGTSPIHDAENDYADRSTKEDREQAIFSLRDISNQQYDGPADDPFGQQDDSDSSFVVLSNQTDPNQMAGDQPEANPFALDSDDVPPLHPPIASGESIDVHTDGIVTYPIEQERGLARLMEERDSLMQDGRDSHGSTEESHLPDPVARQQTSDSIPPRGYLDKLTDWLWGDLSPPATRTDVPDADDEHVVNQVEEEAPFVPMAHGRPVFVLEEQPAQDPAPAVPDPDVAAAAAEAGLDPNGAEAVEDAEDLEGIMELVGLQGPLFGLIQNAIFCAIIVALAIAVNVWIPYIFGKIFLIFLANPVSLLFKMPLRWASTTADIFVDLCIFSFGCVFYWTDTAISFACRPITRFIPLIAIITERSSLSQAAKDYAESALNRLARNLIATSDSFFESDIPTFSMLAHESLNSMKQGTSSSVTYSFQTLVNIANIGTRQELFEHMSSLTNGLQLGVATLISSMTTGLNDLQSSAKSFSMSKILQVNLSIPQRTKPLDYTLASWNSADRALAIILGYACFGLIGLAYLQVRAFLRGKNASGRVDGSIADVLYQAGGVLKVILIISIEMIIFPLFCGLLLDAALLPLFGDVTFASRLNFGLRAPWTSLFIHWFIGTCYMFHFALFVSMCRKLMRTGVLYFIRDPDDPTFHPVRDVLERNLFTQLRKIVFSAVVYGGLVMICLGGVVWGISYAFEGVFPVHWSPNEPVLEFPVDLLFYNFLMPIAVKFFKPSNALHNVYGWWFRACARKLRLSQFLFGERKEDEEGRHVRRTWKAVCDGKLGDPKKPVTNIEQLMIQENKGEDAYFLRDGRFVRAPASDQVRMPKGTHTFLEVDEYNNRVDKLEDPEQGPHGSKNDQFTQVYIPPFFRLRISIFIFLIWLFAATTGVCTTVLPLVLGRRIFTYIAPSHLRMNDIYAFSIGVYILGASAYAIAFASRGIAYLRASLFPSSDHPNPRSLYRRVQSHVYRFLRSTYTYASFTIFLPLLFALLVQVYAVIPLRTYFNDFETRHTIHIVQDWTLGVLYIQAFGRLILWNSPSRPASALRGIVRHGWLNPDARLATRAFIFPATLLMAFLLLLPMLLGYTVNATYLQNEHDAVKTAAYRYSAPALLGVALAFLGLWVLKGAFLAWRRRIRDEVYLIGERLHNFGESKRAKRAAGAGRVDVRA